MAERSDAARLAPPVPPALAGAAATAVLAWAVAVAATATAAGCGAALHDANAVAVAAAPTLGAGLRAAARLPSAHEPLRSGDAQTLPRRGPDLGPDRLRSHGRRGAADALEPEVMSVQRRSWPAIGGPAHGSVSVGTVTGGFLAEAAELPQQGPHHAVLARVAPRNARFGTHELRELVLCAAADVAAHERGAILGVGNLSRASGGDTPWSVSHNNGRDADLAYYARAGDGARVLPDHLYHFGRDLTARASGQRMIFDVASNWALVRALVRCEASHGVEIQRLFAAAWLKRALVTFARAAGEDEAIVQRAAQLLHQPRNAADHGDHLHLRIACSAADRREGCLDAGRAPAEAIGRAPGVAARLPALRAALHAASATLRAAAAERLGLYRDGGAAEPLRRALDDAAPAVRRAAALALLQLDGSHAVAVAAAVAREPDFGAASAMLHGLADAGAADALRAALVDARQITTADGAVTMPIAAVGAPLLAEVLPPAEAARALASALDHPSAWAATAARDALERLCNLRTDDLLLARGALDERAAWRDFAAALPAAIDRDALWLAGFAARGMRLDGGGKAEVVALAEALAGPSPYADTASRLLSRSLRYWPEEGRGARAAPAAFWLPWLRRRALIDGDTYARLLRAPAEGSAEAPWTASAPPLSFSPAL